MSGPMAHEQAQGLLSDYMEGNLSEAERRAVAEHLEQCATCREELELLGKALPLLQGLPRVQAPKGFAGRVNRRMRKSGMLARRRRKKMLRMSMPFTSIVTMAVLMAAVGAMLIVVLIMQQQLELLVRQEPPARMLVDDGDELQKVAAEAWSAGAEVRLTDKPLSPGTDLTQAAEIEIRLNKDRGEDFLMALERAGLQANIAEGDGLRREKKGEAKLHLLVQRRQ